MLKRNHVPSVENFSVAIFWRASGCKCECFKFLLARWVTSLMLDLKTQREFFVGIRTIRSTSNSAPPEPDTTKKPNNFVHFENFLIHYIVSQHKGKLSVACICTPYTKFLTMRIAQVILQLFWFYSLKQKRLCKPNQDSLKLLTKTFSSLSLPSRTKTCTVSSNSWKE